MKKELRSYLKEIKHRIPIKEIFPGLGKEIEILVTGKELFSEVNSNIPSSDVIDYLETVASNLPNGAELSIVVDDEVDFARVQTAYKNFIALSLKRRINELRALTFKVSAFLLVGALLLIISYFLEGLAKRVVYDAVNIIGGFSIWEAADTFVFARSEKKKEVITFLRLYKANWKNRDIS